MSVKIDAYVTKAQLNTLKKNKLETMEQIMMCPAKTYFDCTHITHNLSMHNGEIITYAGQLIDIDKKKSASGKKYTEAILYNPYSGIKLKITWFFTHYPVQIYAAQVKDWFLVCGKLSVNQYYCQVISPDIFINVGDEYMLKMYMKFYPCYKKYKGIADITYKKLVDIAFDNVPIVEPLGQGFIKRHNLLTCASLIRTLHYPASVQELEKAKAYLDLLDLLYFSVRIKMMSQNDKKPVPMITQRYILDKAIRELPYALTTGQSSAIESICSDAMSLVRQNVLIQGDVSCGKTIVALLLMLLYCENGYQTAIVAPTVVLAKQHYEALSELAKNYGFKVAFLSGTLKKKEKTVVLNGIKDGSINMLVTTHAITGKDVIFKNLGLVIIDEEQRFGVRCRESVRDKSDNAITFISMTATPIPRTLAMGLFGGCNKICTIEELPAGRQPVTTIRTDDYSVPQLLKDELSTGRQAYIICAQIDDTDNDEENDIVSTVKTCKIYQQSLPDKKIAVLTGNMPEKEQLEVLNGYVAGDIDVLISTTVVEVGVNNPNSSVIIIQNAERFGLSSLHQLRGRVRRGTYKPYCILISSSAEDNERLEAMCRTDNGFELSKLDLEQRKSGNLIGTKQSGRNKYMELVLSNPELYEYAGKLADELIELNRAELFIEKMNELLPEAD